MKEMEKSAVEWFVEQIADDLGIRVKNSSMGMSLIEQAKEMEEMKIIEAKIELIKSIGNQGKNAPLYGILKTTLIELQQQHNEIIARCLN